VTAVLGDIATVRTGLVLSRKKAKPNSPRAIPYKQISLRCFGDGIRIDRSATHEIFTASEEINDTYFTHEGDVIVRLRAPASALYIDREHTGLLISSLLLVIRLRDDTIDPRYLARYINAPSAQHLLRPDIKGTTIPALQTKDIQQLTIIYPPLRTQKELVRFLDLSDKERELLRRLADEKRQLAQTVLNTIITQHKEEN
jgi:restriction endonuclease S subunit